jgi:hypothetical protein
MAATHAPPTFGEEAIVWRGLSAYIPPRRGSSTHGKYSKLFRPQGNNAPAATRNLRLRKEQPSSPEAKHTHTFLLLWRFKCRTDGPTAHSWPATSGK